jgi:hypothetical protein
VDPRGVEKNQVLIGNREIGWKKPVTRYSVPFRFLILSYIWVLHKIIFFREFLNIGFLFC